MIKELSLKFLKKDKKKILSYFRGINYSLGNEDTQCEYEIAKRVNAQNILSICGSGSRFIPFLALDSLKKIWVLDSSKEQLLFSDLKIKSIKEFSYDDFLLFWGFPPFSASSYEERRKKLFYQLDLKEEALSYFRKTFSERNWQGLIYMGKWEQTFRKMSFVVRLLVGESLQKLFTFSDIKDQQRFYKMEFKRSRFEMALMLLGNAKVFNALLYKGDFVKKNIKESYFDFYQKAYDHLLQHTLARENFFLQICFLGEILYKQGIPLDAKEEIFEKIKKTYSSLIPKIHYKEDDVVNFLSGEENFLKGLGANELFDFVSFSDVPSYFKGERENSFLQSIKKSLAPNAYVILRSYLHVPDADESSYEDVTEEFSDLIHLEKTQMYKIKILKLSENS